MKLVPLGRQSCIKTAGGRSKRQSPVLFLQARAQEKPQEAEVIAVGPGGMVDGKEVTMQVKALDRKLFILNMQERSKDWRMKSTSS